MENTTTVFVSDFYPLMKKQKMAIGSVSNQKYRKQNLHSKLQNYLYKVLGTITN